MLLRLRTPLLLNWHKGHHTSAILLSLYWDEIIFIKVLPISDEYSLFWLQGEFMDPFGFTASVKIKYMGENNLCRLDIWPTGEYTVQLAGNWSKRLTANIPAWYFPVSTAPGEKKYPRKLMVGSADHRILRETLVGFKATKFKKIIFIFSVHEMPLHKVENNQHMWLCKSTECREKQKVSLL